MRKSEKNEKDFSKDAEATNAAAHTRGKAQMVEEDETETLKLLQGIMEAGKGEL